MLLYEHSATCTLVGSVRQVWQTSRFLQLKALKNLLHYQNCTNFVPAFKHSEKRVLKSQSIIKHVSMQYIILNETLKN